MAAVGVLPLYSRQNGSFLFKRLFRSRGKVFITLLFLCLGAITLLSTKGHSFYDLFRRMPNSVSGRLLEPPPSRVGKGGERDEEAPRGVYSARLHGDDARLTRNKQELLEKVDSDRTRGFLAWVHKVTRHNSAKMVVQGGEDADPVARQRRDKVKEMVLHAWRGYRTFAWGKSELRPVSRQGHTPGLLGGQDLGVTIVDSLDTLYIMGLMDEFNDAKKWVQEHLDFNRLSSDVSVFEVNIRFVGGLLSAFALTGDQVFKDKALQLARKLLPAFNTPTGIPFGVVNPKTGRAKNHRWASGGSSILSEFGTLHLEFAYLSDVTGDPIFRSKVSQLRLYIREQHSLGTLYPNYINPHSGRWGEAHTSIGAFGDSFYEYLIKSYVQSNSKDTVAKNMYEDAIDVITKRLVMKSDSGLVYLAESMAGVLMHKMEHLACFAGGMYALGAVTIPNEDSKHHMEIAEGLANTCHESYSRSETGLGPESFRFGGGQDAIGRRPNDRRYHLRPEAVETWFYMWRFTKDQKYRDWAWDAVLALDKYCRTDAGFSGLKDVYKKNSQKDDVQQSFLLAETFKYLYLIFSDDSLVSLDEWVFNTEAHPIPIQEKNSFYRLATVPHRNSSTAHSIRDLS